ncbi:hypothetical protein GBA52_006931 [Prunus armeniaca]|nr:hypothetical protein GBA52_006931 [Prunus armeniaca]
MHSPPQQPHRNGETTPYPIPNHPFHSTVSLRKLRRFNYLILVFRIASFSFSLASFIFMLSTSRGPNSPRWYHFDAFRLVVGANAIVALYSLFEMVASVWEISRGATLFSEVLQVWKLNGRRRDRVGVRVLVAVCGFGGNGVGEGFEREGHVYGLERVLHTGGRGHRPGLCRVSVPGLFVSALGFPGRLLHYQGLSFSSLERERVQLREYLGASRCRVLTV